MKAKRKRRVSDEQMQRIFRDYMEAEGVELVDLDRCFEWADENGRWEAPDLSPRSIFKSHMSKALSKERIKDDDGKPVRPNLSLRIKREDGQGYFHFWGAMLKMTPGRVKMSLQQRLLSLANRAIQLDRDKCYYNDKNTHGAQLELNYDLTPAVENSKHSDEYPEERPEGDDE